jgi:similar to stage IV sporulation protein
MRGVTNFLRGNVTLRVTGDYPERFLNGCGKAGIPFWHLRWAGDGSMTLRIPRSKLRRALRLAPETQCQAEVLCRRGVPDFLLGFRRRYGFLVGLVLALGAVGVLSHVVWEIDVSGNETVSTEQIVEDLREAGLRIGSFAPWVAARDISHRVLLQEPGLSYLAVNLHGIRAEIIVREGEEKPELLSSQDPSDLVAAQDGIVTRIEVWSGEPQVSVGDVVAQGETLITGHIVYTQADTGEVLYEKQTASAGKIWARTWHTLSVLIPKTGAEKVHSGEEITRASLNLWGRTLKFYENSGISYQRYDKITTTTQLTLPGGISLPIFWQKDTYRDYTTQTVSLSTADREQEAKSLLTQRLKDSLGEGDSITRLDFETEEEGDWLRITLKAECCQDIGETAELSTEGIDQNYDRTVH